MKRARLTALLPRAFSRRSIRWLIAPPRSRLAPLRCPPRGSNSRLGTALRRSSRVPLRSWLRCLANAQIPLGQKSYLLLRIALGHHSRDEVLVLLQLVGRRL